MKPLTAHELEALLDQPESDRVARKESWSGSRVIPPRTRPKDLGSFATWFAHHIAH